MPYDPTQLDSYKTTDPLFYATASFKPNADPNSTGALATFLQATGKYPDLGALDSAARQAGLGDSYYQNMSGSWKNRGYFNDRDSQIIQALQQQAIARKNAGETFGQVPISPEDQAAAARSGQPTVNQTQTYTMNGQTYTTAPGESVPAGGTKVSGSMENYTQVPQTTPAGPMVGPNLPSDNSANNSNQAGGTNVNPAVTPPLPANPFSSTLNVGSTGSDVANLQKILNAQGANLTVDGQYGPKTQAAVKAYQQANGLTADGIFGPLTSAKLTGGINAVGNPQNQPASTLPTPFGTVNPNANVNLTSGTNPTFDSSSIGNLSTSDVLNNNMSQADQINGYLKQQADAYAALNQTKVQALQGQANIMYGRNGAGGDDASLQGAEQAQFDRQMAFRTVPAEIAYNSAQMALSLFKQSPAYLTETQARDTAFNLLQTYPDLNVVYDPSKSAQQNLIDIRSALPKSPKYQASLVNYAGYTDVNGVFHLFNKKDISPTGPTDIGTPGTTTPSVASGPTNTIGTAIATQEHGDYSSVNPDSGALGKYQIMPMNLSYAGLQNNAQGIKTFLGSPQLQDQAFQAIIDNLSTKYNGDSAKIAAAYYGGAGGVAKLGTPAGDAPQGKYPSVNSYVKSVLGMTSYPTPMKPVTALGTYLGSSPVPITSIQPIVDKAVTRPQVDFVNDWNSGKLGTARNALGTALGHLFEADNLYSQVNNGSIPLINGVKNFFNTQTGKANVQNYETAQILASNELATAYGGDSQGDREKLAQFGGSNQSPSQHAGYITTATNLLASKLSAMAQQYQGAFGHYPSSLDSLISPLNQVKLAAFAKTNLSGIVNGIPVSPSTQALLNTAQIVGGKVYLPDSKGNYQAQE